MESQQVRKDLFAGDPDRAWSSSHCGGRSKSCFGIGGLGVEGLKGLGVKNLGEVSGCGVLGVGMKVLERLCWQAL